jgi:hypothetical protein
MRRKLRSIHLIVASLLFVVTNGYTCLAEEGATTQPSLSVGSIYIWNGTNKGVVFYLSADKSNYTKFTLGPDGAASPAFDKNAKVLFFVARTGDKLVEKTLEPQKRYRLFVGGTPPYVDIATADQ